MFISEDKKINCKTFLWNITGSIISAASSFILLLCVTRTVGSKEGGIFSLAFATSQILLTVGKFGVRSFQATDIKKEFSFGIYLQTRIWFCLGMLTLGISYTFFANYNFRKSSIFILICIIKMADAIEDVFHGYLQNIGHLDVAGKLLTIRNLFTMFIFGICMFSFKNLLLASLITATSTIIIVLLLNVTTIKHYTHIRLSFDKLQSIYLIKECLPLFWGSFLSLYIYNAPKYAIDIMGSETEVTYYSIIFMPAFIINLFSEFVFKPILTMIAEVWNKKEFTTFFRMIRNFLLIIGSITFIVIVVAYFIGVQILSCFYAVDVMTLRSELICLLVSGGFSAAVYLFYNVLTAMRLQKIIITNYFIASIIVTILSYLFVKQDRIYGATISYLITEIILFSLMLLGTYYSFQKNNDL